MTIIWGLQFRREFAALPDQMKKRAYAKFELFVGNPHHPSLAIKKMERQGEVWEGRITREYRFTFLIQGDTYTLRRIGPHDILRNP